jgi:hypothetical protein
MKLKTLDQDETELTLKKIKYPAICTIKMIFKLVFAMASYFLFFFFTFIYPYWKGHMVLAETIAY